MDKETSLREQEKNLLNKKNELKQKKYDEKKTKIKQEITKLQKFSIDEKNKLKFSFQKIQKRLNDVFLREHFLIYCSMNHI